jgi:hypothetical protein
VSALLLLLLLLLLLSGRLCLLLSLQLPAK